jgi:hypothetical protein
VTDRVRSSAVADALALARSAATQEGARPSGVGGGPPKTVEPPLVRFGPAAVRGGERVGRPGGGFTAPLKELLGIRAKSHGSISIQTSEKNYNKLKSKPG